MSDKHFIDWESEVFGYGYGTGEPHIIPALKRLFEAIPYEGTYNHEHLEAELGPLAAWLLINILCHADMFTYGTSPRYGWLTGKGQTLKAFFDQHTAEQLLDMLEVDSDYVHCMRGHCNCETPCNNPLFMRHQ